MTISLLNQKGDVGKTTLAIHLATALTLKKCNVLLVDTDPQGSALVRSVEVIKRLVGDWDRSSDEDRQGLIRNLFEFLV